MSKIRRTDQCKNCKKNKFGRVVTVPHKGKRFLCEACANRVALYEKYLKAQSS